MLLSMDTCTKKGTSSISKGVQLTKSYNWGEIYFIREMEPETKKFTKFVKVGLVHKTEGRDSFSRLVEHQTGNPRPLKLDKSHIVETSAVDLVEAKLHQVFSKQRIHGEWFQFDRAQDLKQAINVAQSLAAEVEPLVPLFRKAEELKARISNGKHKKSSSEDLETVNKLVVAKAQVKIVNELESLLTASIASAVQSGADVGESTITREINYKPKFLEEAFSQAHPRMYQQYLEERFFVDGRFLLKVKISEGHDLGSEFLERVKEIESRISKLSPSKQDFHFNVVDIAMELTQLHGICDWDVKVLETRLKIRIGLFDVLDGICSWKRIEKSASKFNSVKFAEENPKLAREFVSVPTKTISVKPKKVRA